MTQSDLKRWMPGMVERISCSFVMASGIGGIGRVKAKRTHVGLGIAIERAIRKRENKD